MIQDCNYGSEVCTAGVGLLCAPLLLGCIKYVDIGRIRGICIKDLFVAHRQ